MDDFAEAIRENPSDWRLRLVHADRLLDLGRVQDSHLARADAFLWAFATDDGSPAWELMDVSGSGLGPKLAYFGDGPSVPLVVCWQADRYDTPDDPSYELTSGRAGSDALLVDSRGVLPSVDDGASLAEFAEAVERAGGWWCVAPQRREEDAS